MYESETKITLIVVMGIILVVWGICAAFAVNIVSNQNKDIAQVNACKSIENTSYRFRCIETVTKPGYKR